LSNAIWIFKRSVQQEDSSLLITANCTGCGRCVAACPLRALTLVTERADGFGRKTAFVNALRCTGCGDCLPACPHNALRWFDP
jgi:ferredoxin